MKPIGKDGRGVALRSRGLRIASVGVIAATAFGTLSACGSSKSSSATPAGSSGAATAPSSVTIGEIGTPGEVPAVDFGITKYVPALNTKYHTTIKAQYFTSPTSAFAALLAGQIQYLDASPATMLVTKAKGQGSDLVALTSVAQGGEGVFVAPTKNKSRGTGIDAVKNYGIGNTWGLPSLGGVGQYFVNLALDSEGINYKKVTEISLGAAGTVPALSSGKVDITTASIVQSYPLVDQGKAYLVWFTSGQEAYDKFGYVPADALMSTKTFTSKYPQLTTDLVGVQLQSVAFFRQNENSPQTVYAALSPDAQKDITLAQFTAIWPFLRAVSIPASGILTDQDMDTYATSLKKFGVVPSSYTPAAGITDPSFAQAAYKQLGETAPTTPLDPKYTSVMQDSTIVLK